MQSFGIEATLLQTLRKHGGEVTCCDVTGDGARLASGGGDRTLRVWRWRGGEGWVEEGAAEGAHRYGVTVARWSSSGALLASGGVDGVVGVWAARGEMPVRRAALAAPGAAAVRALLWLGSGVVAGGHDDGSVALWRVCPAGPLARLAAHNGALHALAAPARGALLLSACTEGVLKVFDTYEIMQMREGGAEPAALVWEDGAHDLGALCADASECGQWAATGGHDARVRVWAAGNGAGGGARLKAHAALAGHGAGVTSLRWAGGVGPNARLLSASLDRSARLWTPHGACLLVLPAHQRYLTCVAVARDLSFMVTGSNDKSLRMWSLGALTLDDEIAPTCSPLAHFGVGDLEGIGPVDDDELLRADADDCGSPEGGGVECMWRDAEGGSINGIASSGEVVAVAGSDGRVRVWRRGEGGVMTLQYELTAHDFAATDVDFGVGGGLLLSAGLDGVARVWDGESGAMLRVLRAPAVDEADSGGGGIRACRVSTTSPALLLLATDDGLAPLWSLASAEPQPLHVYDGHPEAALCVAWAPSGALLCVGGAAGELRVHRAPPAARTLHHEPDAHDLGVSSCDFASASAAAAAGAGDKLLLASAGADELVKLWLLDYNEESDELSVQLARSVRAAGGGVASVRWGAVPSDGGGARMVTAGAERWARVWRVRVGEGEGEEGFVRCEAAAPVAGAGGAASAVLLANGELAVGALSGEVAVWRLPGWPPSGGGDEDGCDEDGLDPRWWGVGGVTRWLRDHVTRVPGSPMTSPAEAALLDAVREEQVGGRELLHQPLAELFDRLGLGSSSTDEAASARSRLAKELRWLRRPPLTAEQESRLPHALRCPLSHRALRSPSRAADGMTYERVNLREWWFACDAATSVTSQRRLASGRVEPNRKLRLQLQNVCGEYEEENSDDLP